VESVERHLSNAYNYFAGTEAGKQQPKILRHCQVHKGNSITHPPSPSSPSSSPSLANNGNLPRQVFFGTPHRGADGAKWLGLLTGIVSTALNQPQSKFIKLLETHSAELLKVSEDFRPLATKYAIVSFYEEHVDRILGKLVSSPPPPLANSPRHPQGMMVVFYEAM